MERVLELANIATNKNTVPGDTSALVPYGLRLGSPAMTSRGLGEADFRRVVDLVDRGVELAKWVQSKCAPGKGKLRDFKDLLDAQPWPEVEDLRGQVSAFASTFPVIGK